MLRNSGKCLIIRKDAITEVMLTLLLVCSTQTSGQEVSPKRVLKATTIEYPPFLIVPDKDNESNMKGIIVDILKEMETILNATFEIVLVKDNRWGQQTEDGNWTGMIAEVKSGYADIAAAPLTVSSSRLLHVDMSQPFITFGLRIVIKRPELTDSWNNMFLVLQPFTSVVWILIVSACGMTGAVLCVIGRFSPVEWTNTSVVQVSREKRESFNWQNSFWYIITTFAWQGYRHFPRSYSGRILSVFWWCFALMVLALYIGCLAARLQSSPTSMAGLPFMTFDEMSRQKKVTYGTLKSGSTHRYFQNSDGTTERMINKNMLKFEDNMVSTNSEGVEKVRSSNGRYAFIMEGLLAEFEVSKYPCDLMTVGDDVYPRDYAIVTEKGSPLSSELNHAVLKLKEMGAIKKIHKRWRLGECFKKINQESFIDGETYFDKMDATPLSESSGMLGARLIAGPFILLLVGIVLSALALIAEMFLAKEEIKRGSLSTEEGHKLRDSFEDANLT